MNKRNYKNERRQRLANEPTPDYAHGTPTGYTDHSCRCQPCTTAATEYRAKNRKRSAFREPPVHGTTNGYKNYNCRCEDCRFANGVNNKARIYGITKEEVVELITDAECAVCGVTDNLHIDHDHETGSVRGMLCQRCNQAAGLLGDDVERIKKLAEYLRESVTA